MKQYKVVDERNYYRDNPRYDIIEDSERMFSLRDLEGETRKGLLILNTKKFQKERIVDEHKALLLMIQGIKLEEIKHD